jgi:type VI secretion system protein ImpG
MFNKYFQDELAFLREQGREFSQAYPTLAPLLADRGVDPDVERLLEGVAFLTGRIRQKLDDEMPEFLQSVGLLLFPHLMRCLPSASILEMTPMPNAMREGHVVKAGTEFGTVPVDGTPCTFRSTADCVLAPIAIEDARIDVYPGGRQAIAVTVRTLNGKPLASALPGALRLHFTGENHIISALLYGIVQQLAELTISAAGRGGREVSLGRGAVK